MRVSRLRASRLASYCCRCGGGDERHDDSPLVHRHLLYVFRRDMDVPGSYDWLGVGSTTVGRSARIIPVDSRHDGTVKMPARNRR